MGGTKIFVLQMKSLIRVGIIVLVGLALIIMALVFLLPGRRGTAEEHPQPGATARYIPGTYVSTIILNDVPVHVRVTVSENEILSIYMTDMADIQRVFYPLFEPRMHDLAQEILRYQSAHINPQTDYPVTTGILQQAVISALELAYYTPSD
ncbi:MAG: hypothetical protein FWB91_03960 [Defluviitaleaceae bacterium]|nr:hypothetical protein [Defluviitaleaceae bacterium]